MPCIRAPYQWSRYLGTTDTTAKAVRSCLFLRRFPPSSSRLLAVAAMCVAALAMPTPAQAGTTTGLLDALACSPLLKQPTRLSTALGSGLSESVVRLLNNLTGDQVEHLAADEHVVARRVRPGLRRRPGDRAAQQVTADPAPATPSRRTCSRCPRGRRSTRTIYLDFDGATYSGTRWKNGAEIVSPAYSIDADPTTFSEIERAQIYLAWQTVAEDYAPFDVNVTTRAGPLGPHPHVERRPGLRHAGRGHARPTPSAPAAAAAASPTSGSSAPSAPPTTSRRGSSPTAPAPAATTWARSSATRSATPSA